MNQSRENQSVKKSDADEAKFKNEANAVLKLRQLKSGRLPDGLFVRTQASLRCVGGFPPTCMYGKGLSNDA